MVRRRWSTVFGVLVVLVLLLTACAPQAPAAEQAGAEASAAGGAAASAVEVSPAGEFPIVSEPVTIRAFLCATDMIKDYNDNEFTAWVEELTGLDLEIEVAAQADAIQKRNLLIASDDLPDVIINCDWRLDEIQLLADQGVLLPLNDYIDQYGVEFKKMFETFPEAENLITMADGQIYGFPHINDCYHCSMSQKMWLYQPWLEKLGLETPTTTEEFYQVLKAFKEQDPNGNGRADEIPLSGTKRTGGGWHAQLDQFIMNSFIYNDAVTTNGANHLILEDGTVKAAFAQEEWREGLRYLKKLYSEGLIDPQAFTNDGTQIRQLGENPDIPILGATSAGWYGVFTQNGGPSGRWMEYVPIAPLEGPSGLRQTPRTPYQPFGATDYVITREATNPEAAFRLGDLFYGFDATTRSVFGPEGEDWVRAEAGDESIAGGEAAYTVLKVWSGEEHNRHWNQAAPTFRTNEYRHSQTYNPDDPLERWLYEWTRDLMEPYGTMDKAVPPVVFGEEQAKLFGELHTAIYGVVDEWFANFVIGNYDLDSDWEAYLATLEDSGLSQFLSIFQEAYDAKYK